MGIRKGLARFCLHELHCGSLDYQDIAEGTCEEEDEEKWRLGSRGQIGTRFIFAARERSLSFLQSP